MILEHTDLKLGKEGFDSSCIESQCGFPALLGPSASLLFALIQKKLPIFAAIDRNRLLNLHRRQEGGCRESRERKQKELRCSYFSGYMSWIGRFLRGPKKQNRRKWPKRQAEV